MTFSRNLQVPIREILSHSRSQRQQVVTTQFMQGLIEDMLAAKADDAKIGSATCIPANTMNPTLSIPVTCAKAYLLFRSRCGASSLLSIDRG
jgi:hypothetical protein